jgi:hypothetical protein
LIVYHFPQSKEAKLNVAKSGKKNNIILFEWLYRLSGLADLAIATNSGITIYKFDRAKIQIKEMMSINTTITYCWFEVGPPINS